MAKRKTTSRSSASQPTIGALLAFLLVIVIVFLSRLTGVDLLGGAPTATPTTEPTAIIAESSAAPESVTAIAVPQGFGAQKDFWQVFFTAPSGSSDRATYTGGIDTQLAAALGNVQRTLDVAAYEFNNPVLTQAVLDAHGRGVRVRMVTDDEDGIGDADTTIHQFVDAGIEVVDDGRGDLMHDKFMILDSSVVWTGSWNYTVNDTYRNNNNALALRSQQIVQDYQTEFDEMFTARQFGPRSPANTPNPRFTQDGVPVQVYFASEDPVVPAVVEALNAAEESIRFMAFSFTLDPLGDAILDRAAAGVQVQGIFERTGSQTQFSELTRLFCAGLDARQDGNRYVLHHKVFIVDGDTVVTGSFNLSDSATESNDENLLIIEDADLAAQYAAEFERRWAEAVRPTSLTCS